MARVRRIWKSLSLLLPTAGMLVLYAYIATFSRLTGDDYCLLYFADRFGLLRSIWYWYLNFEGIISGNFIDYFLVYFGENWMGVVLPACLLVLTGNAAFSFAMLLGRSFQRSQKLLAAFALGCALVVTVFMISPRLQQSYYWWAGTRKYVMPLIFVSLYPGLYVKFVQKDWGRRGTLLWYLVSFGLLFFIGGFSETFNPGLFAAFLFALGLRLLLTRFNFKDRAFLFMLVGFLGLTIAFTVMILAPGNSVRQGYFSGPSVPLTVLNIAVSSYLEFLNSIPRSWTISLLFLGVILGAINFGFNDTRKEPIPWWFLPLVILGTFLIPLACFLPFAYVVGEPLVSRAVIDPAFLFVAFLIYCAILVGRLLSSKTGVGDHIYIRTGLATLVFVLLSVSLWNAGGSFYSLSQAHIKYAHEWDKVQTQILRAVEEGQESLLVPPRKNWAGILELSDNPKFYVNQCISRYYGVDIKVDDSLRVPE